MRDLTLTHLKCPGRPHRGVAACHLIVGLTQLLEYLSMLSDECEAIRRDIWDLQVGLEKRFIGLARRNAEEVGCGGPWS